MAGRLSPVASNQGIDRVTLSGYLRRQLALLPLSKWVEPLPLLLFSRQTNKLTKEGSMSCENDSPERIAADIVIALINNGVVDGKKHKPGADQSIETYKKIFRAVKDASAGGDGD